MSEQRALTMLSMLRPGTIVVEILDPIPPGLDKARFLARLKDEIETTSSRLLVEARGGGTGKHTGR